MKWAVAEQAKPRLDAITHALQQAGIYRLILATDPDREGEAIAWHLSQVLAVTSHSAHTEVLSLHRTTLHVCLLDQSATQRLAAICVV
jgi:DNA topoisomerase IA